MAMGVLGSGVLVSADSRNLPALEPGKTIELEFPEAGLPPTLYSVMYGTAATPCSRQVLVLGVFRLRVRRRFL